MSLTTDIVLGNVRMVRHWQEVAFAVPPAPGGLVPGAALPGAAAPPAEV